VRINKTNIQSNFVCLIECVLHVLCHTDAVKVIYCKVTCIFSGTKGHMHLSGTSKLSGWLPHIKEPKAVISTIRTMKPESKMKVCDYNKFVSNHCEKQLLQYWCVLPHINIIVNSFIINAFGLFRKFIKSVQMFANLVCKYLFVWFVRLNK
jgi:tryptophan synthase beta subunit